MTTDPSKTPVEALRRGLEILEMIAASGEAGIGPGQLAERMGLKTTTVQNLLKTLILCGYARRAERGLYRTGWKTSALSRGTRFDLDTDGPVATLMREMAEQTGESVVLTTLVAGRRMELARAEGARQVKVTLAGDAAPSRQPFWSLVTGRVMAAWCSPEELAKLLANEGPPADAADEDALAAVLESIRQGGFAESQTDEIASLACPVLDDSDALCAALGVYLPAYRWTDTSRTKLIKTTRQYASQLAQLASDEHK